MFGEPHQNFKIKIILVQLIQTVYTNLVYLEKKFREVTSNGGRNQPYSASTTELGPEDVIPTVSLDFDALILQDQIQLCL